MKNFLLACILSVPLIISCEKDELEPLAFDRCNISNEEIPFWMTFRHQGESTVTDSLTKQGISYIYDRSHRLTKRYMGFIRDRDVYYWIRDGLAIDSITYNKKGVPVENFKTTPTNYRHEKYVYNNNQLISVEYEIFNNPYAFDDEMFDFDRDQVGFDNFFYNEEKKLVRSEHYIKNISARFYDKTVRTYSYDNNNLQRIEYFKNEVDSANKYGYEIYKQYDNQKNPYTGLFFLEDKRTFSLSVNNPLSKHYYFITNSTENHNYWQHTYSGYSHLGFPYDYPDDSGNSLIKYNNQ